jgi:hypothetical protein
MANPGGKKLLAREGRRWIHVGKFAKKIELAFSYMSIGSGTEK